MTKYVNKNSPIYLFVSQIHNTAHDIHCYPWCFGINTRPWVSGSYAHIGQTPIIVIYRALPWKVKGESVWWKTSKRLLCNESWSICRYAINDPTGLWCNPNQIYTQLYVHPLHYNLLHSNHYQQSFTEWTKTWYSASNNKTW